MFNLHNKFSLFSPYLTYFFRKEVIQYNEEKIQTIISPANPLLTVHATHSTCERLSSAELQRVIPDDDNKCGGLPATVQFCIGARVMLLRNIQCSKGLVNGQVGTVTGFTFVENGPHRVLEKVSVKFKLTNTQKLTYTEI